MLKRCCVKTCNVAYYGGISFHSFPSNQELKKKWLDVLPAGQNITPDSVVCSLHFKPSDFCTVNSVQILKYNVVPSIFPVTCKVQIKPLTVDTTVRTGEQPRVLVPVPKIDPELSVRTRLKFEPDPIEDKEICKIEDPLAEDTDQPSDDLIPLSIAQASVRNTPAPPNNMLAALLNTPVPLGNFPTSLRNSQSPLSNVQAPLSNTQDALSDTMRTEEASADLISNQAQQIDKLTKLLAQREQTIADMKLEINDLMNYISECYWKAGFKASSEARGRTPRGHGGTPPRQGTAPPYAPQSPPDELTHPAIVANGSVGQVPSKLVSNRNVFIVKREWSPDIDQPTSTVGEEVTSDIPQNPLVDVQNTSENEQDSSIGTKRKLDSRDNRQSESKARRKSVKPH